MRSHPEFTESEESQLLSQKILVANESLTFDSLRFWLYWKRFENVKFLASVDGTLGRIGVPKGNLHSLPPQKKLGWLENT